LAKRPKQVQEDDVITDNLPLAITDPSASDFRSFSFMISIFINILIVF
jgi:hypothetical protein